MAAVAVLDGLAKAVDPGLTIVNTSATAISQVTVVIESGGQLEDRLSLPTLPPGVTASYAPDTQILSLTATGLAPTASQWQAALRTLQFSTTSTIAGPRIVTFALGDKTPFSGTGHFYEAVINKNSATGLEEAITWQTAKAQAAAKRLYGLQGYLATDTSLPEHKFIRDKTRGNCWLGASDDPQVLNTLFGSVLYDVSQTDGPPRGKVFLDTNPSVAEGRWFWVTGPEAKQPISIGDKIRSPAEDPVPATAKTFVFWFFLSQPDNSGASSNFLRNRGDGYWGDQPNDSPTTTQFAVEYGGMPGDPVVVLQASRTVQVEFSAPVISAPATPQNNARPIIGGRTARSENPTKVEVTLDLTNDGIADVTYVVATTAGAWSIDTASAPPVSGAMSDLTTATVSKITARTFNNAATSTANGTAYPSPATTKLISNDLTPPPAPTLVVPTQTNDVTPTITGLAEPGSTVRVTITDASGTPQTITVTADPVTGAWSVTPSTLASGPVTISATATDALGNVSTPATASFTIDASAPPAPVISSPTTLTNDATPVIAGSAEPDTLVLVTIDPDNNPATTNSLTYVTIADPVTGAWSVDTATATPTSGTLPSGGFASGDTLALSAVATDRAGNRSSLATATAVVDTTAPAAPVIAGPTSPSNDATPNLVGTGEAGAQVTVVIDLDGDSTTTTDLVTYVTTVDASGNWTIDTATAIPVSGTLPSTGIASGSTPTFTASQRDPAGNVSPSANAQILIDTIAPDAPILTGPASPTNDTTPTISGTAEPGSTMRVVLDTDGDPNTTDDHVVLSTIVAADGTWAVTPVTPLVDGDAVVLEAKATDAAGNTSPGTDRIFAVDTSAPDTSTLLEPSGVTNAALPSLRGTADPTLSASGSTFTVTIDPNGDGDLSDAADFPVTVQPDGSWQLPLVASGAFTGLVDGTTPTIYLAASDSAGNSSLVITTVVVDLAAPAAPIVTTPATPIADPTPVISGTAEAGTQVTVMVDPDGDPLTANTITYVTTADPAGNWAVDTGSAIPLSGTLAPGGFTDGPVTVYASSSDRAGNASPIGTGFLTIDTSAPAAPVISGPLTVVPGASPVLTGTGEAGADVTVTIDPDGDPLTADAVTYTTVVAGDGTWEVDTATATPTAGTFPVGGLLAGVAHLSAIQHDAAGNVSPNVDTDLVIAPAEVLVTPVITGPLAPVATGTPTITGTAPAGAEVVVTLDPDQNPATSDSVSYEVVAAADGTWSVPLVSAIPLGESTPITALPPGTIAEVTAVTVGAGGATSSPATVTIVITNSTTIAATVTFGGSEFTFDGAPKPVAVTTAPAALAVRVFWVDATTPSAAEVSLDPADPADAGKWPSAAGRYRIRAVIVDLAYTGSTVGELRIVDASTLDLDARRCGFGANIAVVGLLAALGLAQVRLRRSTVLAALAAVVLATQGSAAEGDAPAPVAEATPMVSDSAPLLVQPAPSFRYGGKYEALPPDAVVSAAPGPVPSDWWLMLSVTRQPDISLPNGDGEQEDDARLVASDWAGPWGVSAALRQPLPICGGDSEQHVYVQAGLGINLYHGDERWQTSDLSREYAFTERIVTIPVQLQIGWEQRCARNLWLDLGLSGGVGPTVGAIDGAVIRPGGRESASTTAYGVSVSWALNAALWYRWADDHHGIGLLGAWGNTRTSFSYQVEESLVGISRERTFDRRLDSYGFSAGLGYRWIP